jgi:hypothetical protein
MSGIDGSYIIQTPCTFKVFDLRQAVRIEVQTYV